MALSESANEALLFETFMQGRNRAWGIFEDRFGTTRREFVIDIDGRLAGGDLHLEERFAYDDGERETRLWGIRAIGADLYEGWCDDLHGRALGRRSANIIRWRYRFNLKVGTRKLLVDFDERMVLRSPAIALDRAQLSKWGVRLGSVTLCYQKL